MSLPFLFWSPNGNVNASAGQNFTETFADTSHIDTSTTTAKIDTTNKEARLPFTQDPTTLIDPTTNPQTPSDSNIPATISLPPTLPIDSNQANLRSVYVSAENSIYYFGGQSSGHNVVVKYSITNNAVTTLNTSFPAGYDSYVFNSNPKLVYDYDHNKIILYNAINVFVFDVSTKTFNSNVATTPTIFFDEDTPLYESLVDSIPTYIPASDSSDLAGKTIFIGGEVMLPRDMGMGEESYGNIYTFDDSTMSFSDVVNYLPPLFISGDAVAYNNSNNKYSWLDKLVDRAHASTGSSGNKCSNPDSYSNLICASNISGGIGVYYPEEGGGHIKIFGPSSYYYTLQNPSMSMTRPSNQLVDGARASNGGGSGPETGIFTNLLDYGLSANTFVNDASYSIQPSTSFPFAITPSLDSPTSLYAYGLDATTHKPQKYDFTGSWSAQSGLALTSALEPVTAAYTTNNLVYFVSADKKIHWQNVSSGANDYASVVVNQPTVALSPSSVNSFTFSWSAATPDDILNNYEYQVNSTGWHALLKTTTSVTVQGIATVGTNTFYLRAKSIYGNYSTANSRTFVLNTSGLYTFGADNALEKNFIRIQDNNNVYLVGGLINGYYSNAISKFDGTISSSAQTLSMNVQNYYQTGIFYNSKYYLFDTKLVGSGGKKVYSTTSLDSATTPFTSLANLAYLTANSTIYPKAVLLNNYIYILSKNSDTNYNPAPELIRFNPADNTSAAVSIPSNLVCAGGNSSSMAVGSDNKIYLFGCSVGNYDGNITYQHITSFDPSTTPATFSDLGQILPSTTTSVSAPITNDDKSEIYFYNIASVASTPIYAFDVSSKKVYDTRTKTLYAHTSGNSAFYNGKIYLFGGGTSSIESVDPRPVLASNLVQSTKINSGSANIYKVNFSAQCNTPNNSCTYSDGRSIAFQISVDGGATWQSPDSNGNVSFASAQNNFFARHALAATGSDLRWRATLTGTTYQTPEITNVSINYYGTSTSLSLGSAGATKGAGEPSDAVSVGILDSDGNKTVANSDTTVNLSSDSDRAKFATSPNGPWNSTLAVTIPKDQESASFYYLNYQSGNHTVFARSVGLIESSEIITTNPGPISQNSPISFSSNNVTAGNKTNIDITLLDNQSNPLGGKSVDILSSNSKDASPLTHLTTAADGTASGAISSNIAETKTISLHIMPDNVFLEVPTKLIFVPAAVSSIALTSSSKQTVNAGENFTLTASLFDRFGNLANNSTNSISITSTDTTFSNLSHQFNAADAGDVDFDNVVLKSAGKQTLTAKDNDTGASGSLDLYVLTGNPLSATSKISADKTKLVLGHDKANITVKIADQFGNGIANTPVHVKNNLQFGSLDRFDSVTDSSGNAVFVYTPTQVGKETFSAFTDTFAIGNSLVIENVADNLVNQLGGLVNSLQNNATAKAVANIAKNLVATTVTLGLIPIIATVLGSAPAALHAINYGISLSLEAIGIRRRRRSWGRVYDSTNGKGIDYALVRLYDQQTMKLKGTIVTDIKGKYYFQPNPGVYVLTVSKRGYIFPTQIFATLGIAKINKNADKDNSHYIGQTVSITDKDNFLNIEIPIDPIKNKATFWLRIKIIANQLVDLITVGFSDIFIPLLVIGLAASLFSTIVIPDTRNITLSIIYFVITSIFIISKIVKFRRTGFVYDVKTGKPISEAVISIFDKIHHTLKETRVTDRYGRYSLFAETGEYELQVTSPNYHVVEKSRLPHFMTKKQKQRIFKNEVIKLQKPQFIVQNIAMTNK